MIVFHFLLRGGEQGVGEGAGRRTRFSQKDILKPSFIIYSAELTFGYLVALLHNLGLEMILV